MISILPSPTPRGRGGWQIGLAVTMLFLCCCFLLVIFPDQVGGGPSHGVRSFTRCCPASPPWGLQFTRTFSSTRLYPGVGAVLQEQAAPARVPQGLRALGPIYLLWHEILRRLQQRLLCQGPPWAAGELLWHLEHLLPSPSVTTGPAEVFHTFFSCSSRSCCAVCFLLKYVVTAAQLVLSDSALAGAGFYLTWSNPCSPPLAKSCHLSPIQWHRFDQ